MNDGLDFTRTYQNLFNKWWLIVVIALAAGLLGWGISYLQQPLYQAEAVFYASIDFTEINFENLVGENGLPYQFTQYDEDLALEVVKTILISKIPEVFEFAVGLDSDLDYDSFVANMQIQRHHGQWFLRFRHKDPLIAQQIVNHWAEMGMQALAQAQAADAVETYVMVDLVSLAQLSEKSIYRNRGTLVLAGAVVGLVAGIIWVDARARFSTQKEQSA